MQKNPASPSSAIISICLSLLGAVLADNAAAANLTWGNGSGGVGDWDTATIWSGSAWVSNSGAIFPSAAGAVTIDSGVTEYATNLTFTVPSYNILGAGSGATAGTLSLSSPATIFLPASATVTSIGAILTGNGYTFSGTNGILVLGNQNNSFSSPVSISGASATVVINTSQCAGPGPNTYNLSNGGILQNNDQSTGTLFLASNINIVVGPGTGTVNVNTAGNLTYGGIISGSGLLNRLGGGGNVGGVLTLTASNVNTGGTTLSGGVTQLSGSGTLGGPTNNLTVATAVLDLGGSAQKVGVVVFSGTGTNRNGTLTSSNSFTATLGAGKSNIVNTILDGTATFSQTGAGTTYFSTAHTYSGLTTVSAGSLLLSGSAKLGVSGTPLTVSGGIVDLGGTTQTVGAVILSGSTTNQNGTLIGTSFTGSPASGKTNTVTAVLAGNGATFSQTAAGTTVLAASNTFTGKTSVSAGVLSINSFNSVSGGVAGSSLGAPATVADGTISLGSAATGGNLTYTGPGETTDRVIDLAGATGGAFLVSSGTGPLVFTNDMTTSGSGAKTVFFQGTSTATNTFAGVIKDSAGGTTALTKAGLANWIFTGINTFSGVISNANGTLKIGGSGQLGSGLFTNNILLGGSGTMIFNTAASQTLGGVIVGTATAVLNQAGPGTLTLTASNTFPGATTITGGTLALGAGGSIGGSAVSVSSGATLANVTAATTTIGGTLTFSSGAFALFTAAGGPSTSVGSISLNGISKDLILSNNTLTINVTGSALAAGTYRLMDCTGNLSGAANATPVVTGVALAGGYAATVTTTAGAAGHVDLVVTGPANTPVNFTGETRLGDGTFQLNFAGTAGQNYITLATTNLTPPATWTPISTNTVGTNGLFQYTDLSATNFTSRFYRTVLP